MRFTATLIFILSFFQLFSQDARVDYFRDSSGYFFFIGLRGEKDITLVWDEILDENFVSYILERSDNGSFYQELTQIDKYNTCPNVMVMNQVQKDQILESPYNKTLYTTETGSGRYIYNQERPSNFKDENKQYFYRIKFVYKNRIKYSQIRSFDFYQKFRSIFDSQNISGIKEDNKKGEHEIHLKKAKELSNNLQFTVGNANSENKNNEKGSHDDEYHDKSLCPNVGITPGGACSAGPIQTIVGQCCSYQQQDYLLYGTNCMGDCCCNIDCSPSSFDSCCLHTCNDYAICGCVPWLCCPSNSIVPLIVTSTTHVPPSISLVQSSCNNVTATLTGGQAPFTYDWSTGDVINSSSNSSSTVFTFSGTIDLTVTDAFNCSQSSTINVVAGLSATMAVTAMGVPTTIVNGATALCKDDNTADVEFNGYNGSMPYTFTYQIDNGPILSVTSPNFSNSVTIPVATNNVGTFNYTLLSVTSNGVTCNPSETVTVTVSIPNGVIESSANVCLNDNGPVINFIGSNISSPYTFDYSLNGGISQSITTNGNDTVSIIAPTNVVGTFNYLLTNVSSNNNPFCVQALNQSISIIVNDISTATISGDASICENSTAPVVTFTGSNGVAPYTFHYRINGGAIQTLLSSVGNTATITAPTSTVGTFIYELIDVHSSTLPICVNPINDTVIIDVSAIPSANLTGAIAKCLNDVSPQLTFNGLNGVAPYTFLYNINGGSSQTITTTSGNSISINVPTNIVGTFNYQLASVSSSNVLGCSQVQSEIETFVVKDLPTAAISGNISVCQNDAAPQILFSGFNSVAPYTFNYTINGGASNNVTVNGGNTISVSAPTSVAGNFLYELTGVTSTSNPTCFQNQIGSVNVIVNTLPTATIQGTDTICQNDPQPQILFTGANSIAPYTFSYRINGGIPQSVTTVAGNSVLVSVPTTIAGIFTYEILSITSSSSPNCSQNQVGQAIITINSLPLATISGGISLCENDNEPQLTITASNSVAPYTFTYNLNNGANIQSITTMNDTIMIIVPTNIPGTFNYNLIDVTSSSIPACFNIQNETETVIVHPNPIASFTLDPQVLHGINEPITNFFNSTTGATTYSWNFGDNSGLSNEVNPIHTYPNDNFLTYEIILTAQSSFGCIDKDTAAFSYLEDLIYYVPNSFTPNGDELNNTFKPVFFSGFDPFSYKLTIFDRWGEIIFESLDFKTGWDGTYGNKLVQNGVYTWVIEFKDKYVADFHKINGFVNILL